MAGTFQPRRGWKKDWDGDKILDKMLLAAKMGIDDVSTAGADLARSEHEWDNRSGQTEAAVFTKEAVIELTPDDTVGVPHVWGEWGVEDRPRFDDRTGVEQKVTTKDVALFLEFGTSKMAARPWLYPAWDATKVLLPAAVAAHYKELTAGGNVGVGANAGWRRFMAGF